MISKIRTPDLRIVMVYRTTILHKLGSTEPKTCHEDYMTVMPYSTYTCTLTLRVFRIYPRDFIGGKWVSKEATSRVLARAGSSVSPADLKKS